MAAPASTPRLLGHEIAILTESPGQSTSGTSTASPAAASTVVSTDGGAAMAIMPDVSTTLAVVTAATPVNVHASPPKEKDELCPACAKDGRPAKRNLKTTHWVECEACRAWFHWDCVSGGRPLSSVDKW